MMQINILKKNINLKNYAFYSLIALELLMSFTFLGYIHIEPISITFAYIPIIIAACFLGPWQSTVIGFVCGLSSLYKASAYYVMSYDQLFSPFMSGYPIKSILLSIGTRTLFGLICGLLFILAEKCRAKRVLSIVIAFLAPRLHSVLVYLTMKMLFPETMNNFRTTFQMDIGSLIVSVLCVLLTEIIHSFLQNKRIRIFLEYVEHGSGIFYKEEHISWQLTAFILTILGAATVAAVYFTQRISYMLSIYGLNVSAEIGHDLLHLQIQFMIAMMALLFLMVLTLMLIFRAIAYREYLGQMDSLTSVMNRKMFLEYCESIQKKNSILSGKTGYYMFVDVDNFKKINDTFGHPEGDRVLRYIAKTLQNLFGFRGEIGRMGGDEFAVMLDGVFTENEMKMLLSQFQSNISDILGETTNVTCSIGVCHFAYPRDIQTIYREADQMLYQAKNNGRNCYVIGELDSVIHHNE